MQATVSLLALPVLLLPRYGTASTLPAAHAAAGASSAVTLASEHDTARLFPPSANPEQSEANGRPG
jgi:hypothetical protein